jgi:hypothetical protein
MLNIQSKASAFFHASQAVVALSATRIVNNGTEYRGESGVRF